MVEFLRFRSRIAVWTLRVLLLIALIGGLAYGVYWLGGCEAGFKSPARCTSLPDAFGQAMFSAFFIALVSGRWIGIWIALVALIWEFAVRMIWKAPC